VRFFVTAISGAIIWIALIEGKTVVSLAVGALIAVLAGRIFFGNAAPSPVAWRSPRRIKAVARLVIRFTTELFVANAEQLRIVFSPRIDLRPKWAVYPTELKSPSLQILLSLLISLTPGTVTVARRSDHLVLHLLDSPDPAIEIDRIRTRFESLLLELER